MNLTEAELIIIQNLSQAGGTGNVMEFLDYTVSDFDRGFTIANEMQNKDLVKLLYSNFNKNMVVVEITLVGYNAAKSGK
jgi:hypothetical protein